MAAEPVVPPYPGVMPQKVKSEPLDNKVNDSDKLKPPPAAKNRKRKASVAQEFFEEHADKLGALKPIVRTFVDGLERSLPYMEKYYGVAQKYYEERLQQYYSQTLVELFLGFVLLFFGGNFALTIACYTAIKLSGWDLLKSAVIDLWISYGECRRAIEKDEELLKECDLDGDGKLKTSEVAMAAYDNPEVRNKITMTLLRSLDPNKMMSAFKGIWVVLLAVMATLQSQFAQQIAIGANIGNVVKDMLQVWVAPKLQMVLRSHDSKLEKWSDFILICFSRMVCIVVSIFLTKIVAAFHSALKGGEILSKHIIIWLEDNQMIHGTNKEIQNVRIFLMYSLSAYGFYTQFMSGFKLAWYLSMPLFPFVMVESMLSWLTPAYAM